MQQKLRIQCTPIRYCLFHLYCWLRFVLAAVSPAVVVPSLLSLQARGYGTDKGISTLVIAASSIDDIIAITGFGVVLGIAFASGLLTHIDYCWQILYVPCSSHYYVSSSSSAQHGSSLGEAIIVAFENNEKMCSNYAKTFSIGLLTVFSCTFR